MKDPIQGGFIKEFRDNMNLSYIIEDEQYFFETGYKVLQSQVKNGFVKCVRVTHNGKIKLIYNISKYKSLQSILHQLTAESFLTVISKLLNVVIEVRNNGFMQSQNIDVSFHKVFIDNNNLNVYLVYLPLNIETDANSNMVFERNLKKNIIEAISRNPNLNSELTARLYYAITSGNQPLEVIIDNLKFRPNFRGPIMHQTPNPMNNTPNGRDPQQAFIVQENKGQVFNSTKPYISMPENHVGQDRMDKLSEKSLKIIFLALCQLLTLISVLVILLAFDFNAAINTGITLLLLAIDLILSSLIIVFLGQGKEKASAPYVYNSNNDVNHRKFQVTDEGGATEVLEEIFKPSIAIVGDNTPVNIELIISKTEFLIGKKGDQVDGSIQFNKAISRVHCKITCVDNKYYITDMGSANGTYVNGLKVAAGKQIPITVGDRIKLANSEFLVRAI